MITGAIVIASGLLVMGIAWAGRVGKLPRNHFAGIRLPSTMRSDRAWVAAHRAGWAMTLVSSFFLVALGMRIMAVGAEESEDGIWWFIGPMLIALLIGTVQGHRAAKAEYAKEQGESR